jgi:pyruvate/2-oxoglutarate dehydrogenase complex dihydrolipoamide dehydrogenase (E3) component
VVDEQFRTNNPRIYAAGDVLEGERPARAAGQQAFEAARNALLPSRNRGRPSPMAWVTLTDPEVAVVGLTETMALKQSGDGIVVTRWDLARVDRARYDDEEDGFIKLLSDARGRIIGATIVAKRAGDVSGELGLAIAHRLKVGDVAGAMQADPSYAAAVQQMTSHVANTRWLSSPTARLMRRFRGFGRRS